MAARKVFQDIYRYLQGIIVPSLKYSQYLYEDVLKLYVNNKTEWLDLGCGQHILPPWRLKEEEYLIEKCKSMVGIDRDAHSLRENTNLFNKVMGDITELPFRDESFDLVTANMVVEHLNDPEVQFREVNRILKKGGCFIFHTPNVNSYSVILGRCVPDKLKTILVNLFEGRKEEDVFDTYYKANTRSTINTLSKKSGFNVLKTKMIVSSPQFIIIPPLLIFELIWIRILMTRPFKSLRTNIISVLIKKAE